jgi:hypothetical protein
MTAPGNMTGITSVTRGPADLIVPSDGESYRYGLGFPMQVAPRQAAARPLCTRGPHRKAAEPRILYGEPVELAAAASLIRYVDGSLLFSVRLCARLFHAAALQEVGGAGIEGVGQVHEQETGCEQRMGRAVGEAEAPHDGAYGSSNYLEVGAGGPVLVIRIFWKGPAVV